MVKKLWDEYHNNMLEQCHTKRCKDCRWWSRRNDECEHYNNFDLYEWEDCVKNDRDMYSPRWYIRLIELVKGWLK